MAVVSSAVFGPKGAARSTERIAGHTLGGMTGWALPTKSGIVTPGVAPAETGSAVLPKTNNTRIEMNRSTYAKRLMVCRKLHLSTAHSRGSHGINSRCRRTPRETSLPKIVNPRSAYYIFVDCNTTIQVTCLSILPSHNRSIITRRYGRCKHRRTKGSCAAWFWF